MTGLRRTVAGLVVTSFAFAPAISSPRAQALTPDLVVCDQPAGDPPADSQDWRSRDVENILCATQRQQDSTTNPAFTAKWALESAQATGEFVGLVERQALEPTRPHVNPVFVSPTARVTDPFRAADEWESAGRGQFQEFSIIAETGAKLTALLFSPNPQPSESPLPGLTFTPGLQSFNEVNIWFAEDLAEAGYMVLILDPQGQGRSENLPHRPDGSIDCGAGGCPNTPTDDFPETRSAIEFLLSTPSSPYPHAVGVNAEGTLGYNPLWARLDPSRIGIAGHSLGAIAATDIGQRDARVKAVVSFDNIDEKIAADLAFASRIHAPTLWFGVDYEFPSLLIPKDPASPPDPDQHLEAAFGQLVAAGIDTMAIDTRASTHYEFGYQPFPASFQASRYGERVASYYTIAWFDRYLKGDLTATSRLTALEFDDSADRHSIGTGTFDLAAALAQPTDPTAGNVPYRIAGKCVANLLSFYYHSAYWLNGGALTSGDMRGRGC
jgi:dienelactone hydrolase